MKDEPTILCDIHITDAEQLEQKDFGGEIELYGERILIFHRNLADFIWEQQDEIERLKDLSGNKKTGLYEVISVVLSVVTLALLIKMFLL